MGSGTFSRFWSLYLQPKRRPRRRQRRGTSSCTDSSEIPTLEAAAAAWGGTFCTITEEMWKWLKAFWGCFNGSRFDTKRLQEASFIRFLQPGQPGAQQTASTFLLWGDEARQANRCQEDAEIRRKISTIRVGTRRISQSKLPKSSRTRENAGRLSWILLCCTQCALTAEFHQEHVRLSSKVGLFFSLF